MKKGFANAEPPVQRAVACYRPAEISNTNLKLAFDPVLDTAVSNKLKHTDSPAAVFSPAFAKTTRPAELDLFGFLNPRCGGAVESTRCKEVEGSYVRK